MGTLNTHIVNINNKGQEPTDFNVLQLRILTKLFKIFKTWKDEMHTALNILTTQ